MNQLLHFKLRENKGKSLLGRYKNIFLSSGFGDLNLEHVSLNQSDHVLKILKKFQNITKQIEILDGNSNCLSSILLKETFSNFSDIQKCYVFSDDVYYCGMYLTEAKFAKQYCLNVAKFGYSNTCFVLDANEAFFLTINYYNQDVMDLGNTFDIQLKRLPY